MFIAVVIAAILGLFPFAKIHYGKQLSFSREPGFYDSPFYLSILGGKGGAIHYTLDGSEPTVNDPVFDRKNPLYIEDATNHPNVYSMRTDTSTGFLTDLLEQYDGWIPGYTVPNYPIEKCTIIRASLFNSSGDCLNSITSTYFIGFREEHACQDIYTASIVTSPRNLFDENTGIYVTGNTLKLFFKANTITEPNWWRWTSNYSNSGMDWERPAHITIFDTNRNIALTTECGIRIKGGASRAFIPKSISCYAREKYSDSNNFHTDIFHTGIFPHKIVLFSGGNDTIFKLYDYLVNNMAQDLSFATMDFIPCALFLDGEYWGMYYITEDYNAEYIHDHYQVAKDNIIMIKNGAVAEGTDSDYESYQELLSLIAKQDMSSTNAYNEICNFIDMNSYMDYYATQIYIARCSDWPGNNYALWRTRENDGSKYGDAKWRWMLFDVNSGGLHPTFLYNNTLQEVLATDTTFASLYQNEDFRRQFAKRLQYIGTEVFAPEKCNQFIDQYAQTLKEPLAASNKRFYMDEKSEEFEQYVVGMEAFFDERYEVVWDFLKESMGKEWLLKNGIQK